LKALLQTRFHPIHLAFPNSFIFYNDPTHNSTVERILSRTWIGLKVKSPLASYPPAAIAVPQRITIYLLVMKDDNDDDDDINEGR
jgi:hypothetical protein